MVEGRRAEGGPRPVAISRIEERLHAHGRRIGEVVQSGKPLDADERRVGGRRGVAEVIGPLILTVDKSLDQLKRGGLLCLEIRHDVWQR